MRKAILEGNEETLGAELANSSFWYPTETYVSGERKVNIRQVTERLARNEFNTWYVRGFARRLLDEGVAECQIYRAAPPKWDIAACSEHEGEIRPVQECVRRPPREVLATSRRSGSRFDPVPAWLPPHDQTDLAPPDACGTGNEWGGATSPDNR